MPKPEPLTIDAASPPFSPYTNLQRLGEKRGGHGAHGRHHLFVGREKRTRANVLIKVTAKPGLAYERDLDNERRTLTTINRELPDQPYFPLVHDHGRLSDGRVYLVTSLFDEFPLATIFSEERAPKKLVTYLRIAIEITRALTALHELGIVHVDLNPMNVLCRVGAGRPVIRLVDFESSYERQRHGGGEFYNPPTTAGYSAPEVSTGPPDAGADIFSLGVALYAMLAGAQWTAGADPQMHVRADDTLDDDLRDALLHAVDADPGRRFVSAATFRTALGAYLEGIWPGRSW